MIGLDRNLWLLFALNLAVGFSNQLIGPLFPLYLENLSASEMKIALVMSLASVAATALMLPSGLLIDRIRKKRMLLMSVVLSAAAYLLGIPLALLLQEKPGEGLTETKISRSAP